LKRYQKKLGMAMVDAWMKALRGVEMSLRMKMNSLHFSAKQITPYLVHLKPVAPY
jgi:hypothetical protein